MTCHSVRVLNRIPYGRPRWERNDCAVRALTFAAGIPYLEAHEIVAKEAGRRNQEGTDYSRFYECIERHGFCPWDDWRKFGKTASKVFPVLAKMGGRWIVTVTGHYTPIVNGTIKDMKMTAPGVKVRAVHLMCGKP